MITTMTSKLKTMTSKLKTMTTKDIKDHLKTTHSQPDFFRPCLLKSQPGLVNKGFDEIAHLIIHYQHGE